MTRSLRNLAGAGIGAVLALAAGIASAQIPAAGPANSFTASDEARLGQEAAAAVRQHLKVVSDPHVVRLMAAMKGRLSNAVPRRERQPSFRYEFSVLNVREVTSFSLPGGPVFVSAPLIGLLPGDDALAGILAHELAHVVLRHATRQATAGEQFQIGAVSGRQLGLAAAVPATGVLEQGAAFSIATYFLSFDAAHEVQAESMGLRIMAAAGYKPAGFAAFVAAMRLEGAEWLGRHPNARPKTETGPARVSAGFTLAQTQLRSMGRSASKTGNTASRAVSAGRAGFGVAPPDGVYRDVTAGDRLRFVVPESWRRVLSGNTVTFIPDGGGMSLPDGPSAITHGIEVGVARGKPGSIDADAIRLLSALGRHDPKLIWTPAFRTSRIAGRHTRSTTMSHVCGVTGEFETVMLTAMHLDDGSLLYFLGVSPEAEAGLYRGVFEQIVLSLQIVR